MKTSKINISIKYLVLIEVLLYVFNIVSLGIFYPLFLYLRCVLVYSNTQISNRKLVFKGKIWNFYLKYLYWYILTILTLGIYKFFLEFRIYKWATMNTYIDGEEGLSYFKKDIVESFLINIMCGFIFVLTLGIGYPIIKCIKYRWRLRNTIISGHRLMFVGDEKELAKKYLLWIVLTILTLGIFIIFIKIYEERYRVENTLINDDENKDELGEKEERALEYIYLTTNSFLVKSFLVLLSFSSILGVSYILTNLSFLLIFIDLILFVYLLFLFNLVSTFASLIFNKYKLKKILDILILILITIIYICSVLIVIRNKIYRLGILLLNISLISLLAFIILNIYKCKTKN